MNRRTLFKALVTLQFAGGLLPVLAKQCIKWQCSQCDGGWIKKGETELYTVFIACDCVDGHALYPLLSADATEQASSAKGKWK